jgi:DNA mismatch endonuclease (patch repair protein)
VRYRALMSSANAKLRSLPESESVPPSCSARGALCGAEPWDRFGGSALPMFLGCSAFVRPSVLGRLNALRAPQWSRAASTVLWIRKVFHAYARIVKVMHAGRRTNKENGSSNELYRPRPLSAEISRRMQKVKQRDTAPETKLRSLLHNLGLRFRVDVAAIAGVRSRPDIVFRRSRVAVFVNGCFWHGCKEHRTIPKNNSNWWANKLAATADRDHRTDLLLQSNGWVSVRVWEHADLNRAARDIHQLVLTRKQST